MGFVALDLAGDAGHRLDRLHGEVAHSGLVAQHHSIDALVDGAGHIAHLGPRRTRIAHHRIEHLRGDDHGALGGDALLDDAPLRVGNHLGRQLHAQVAARHHDAVRRLDDLVDAVEALLIFDLRDDLDGASVRIEDLLHGRDIAGATHERVGDEVDVVRHGPLDEPAVLLGDRRQVDRHARNVDALARTQRAAGRELAKQLLGALLHDAELQFAVGDEHTRPDGDVADDARDVHVDRLARGAHRAVRTADRDLVAGPELDRLAARVVERRDANFGPLRIDHDRNRRIDAVHRLDDMRGTLFGHMRRVDADDVHAGVVEVLHELLGAPEVRHRGHDLGFFHSVHNPTLN